MTRIEMMLTTLLTIAPGVALAARFTPLEQRPVAISGDGNVVLLGCCGGPAIWTEATGSLVIPELEIPSRRDISSDGRVIVGEYLAGYDQGIGVVEGYRWTQEDGFSPTGRLGGVIASSWNFGVSGDGTTLVGWANSTTYSVPTIWTEEEGLRGVTPLPAGRGGGWASAASHDGSILGGYMLDSSGTGEAFRWSADSGYTLLGDLANEQHDSSFVSGVSFTGEFLVGTADSAADSEAFLWSEAVGMQGLGLLSGSRGSQAFSVSADGQVVVGVSGVAFMWTPEAGMQSIFDVAASRGLDLSGWFLDEAVDVSADGKIIVGSGYKAGMQGWLLDLPEPWPTWLTGLGVLAMILIRSAPSALN